MRRNRFLAILVLIGIALLGMRTDPAAAALYNRVTTMAPLGQPAASTDIMFIDPTIGRLMVADRTNGGLDVYDTRAFTFIGLIPTPTGLPNGVIADRNHLVFAGNGSSTLAPGQSQLSSADSLSLQPIATIRNGGIGRLDELGIDNQRHLLLGVNDQDTPVFITVFDVTNPAAMSIVGQLSLPQATAGGEQPVFDPETNSFFVTFPNWAPAGGPAVVQFSEPTRGPDGPSGSCGSGPCITNSSLQIVNVLPVTGSTGATGLSLGPNGRLWVGAAPNPVVMDKRTGAILTTYRQMSNPDENWFNPTSNQFITVSNTAGQQNLCFADANTLAFIECDPVGTNHNVAADPANNAVFVLARVTNPICVNGCIEVFTTGAAPTPCLDCRR